MSSTKPNDPTSVEIINIVQRRRWTTDEKARMVQETLMPGASVSAVGRMYGVNPNLLYRWRKLMDDVAIQTEETVVGASEVRSLKKRICELERMLGKKTMEAEILREMVELAQEKKLISRSVLPKGGDIL